MRLKTNIMKKTISLLIIASSFCFSLFAQSDKFTSAMATTLQQYEAAKTAEDLIAVEAKFERIGDAEKTQWLPYYYAALVKARMAQQRQGGDPDKVADDAQVLLDKAESLSPKNSEIYCVKYIIASARLIVDPQSRYMQYLPVMEEAITNAKKADPTNPRPYVLQAIGTKNTPESFGGGCAPAKPLAQKALEMYTTFKPASALNPNWGKEIAESIINDCK